MPYIVTSYIKLFFSMYITSTYLHTHITHILYIIIFTIIYQSYICTKFFSTLYTQDMKFRTASRDHSGNSNASNTGCHFTDEPSDIFSLNCVYYAAVCDCTSPWLVLETRIISNKILRGLYLRDIFIHLRHS